MFVTLIVPFLVYWLILFVACWILLEYAQTYLYDEVTPAMPLKVAVGTLIFAGLLTWRRTSFESLFLSDLPWSVFQAIVWFVVFTLLFRFHPPHALGISLAAFVILSGAATLAINSMTGANPEGVVATRAPSKPVRQSLGTGLPPPVADSAPVGSDQAEKASP
ncbi:MAG: hypothetical protein KatS3mg108_1796 [Isosphaeraceae bacterium]|nr:MAG: hypothetical protein KatS3mg108_1796 [Isosphaeraceae bacterium]